MATLAQKLAQRGQTPVSGVTTLSRSEMEQVIAVTATANTDFVIPVPKGARILSVRSVTDTAFTAGTDAQISFGKTAGGAEYVAAVTVKTVGAVNHTLVNAQAADYEALPQDGINCRLVQSGTATAVGRACVYVGFAMPA
jgi:hypothetical protein